MFWNKKIKSPVSEADEEWLNSDLTWLREAFSEEHFHQIRTITPTVDFYNRTFSGTEEDAHFVLERTKELMAIQNDHIKLAFFDNQPTYGEDGSMLSTPSPNIQGSWDAAAGTYQQTNEGETIISLDLGQLEDPIALIATISHELAHVILLGEGYLEENDEFLTDLTAIFYGYGLFLGNSSFQFSQRSTNFGSEWGYSRQGYLPEQVIAYAMAWLSFERNEELYYAQYLNASLRKYVEQSYRYLESRHSE